MVIASIADHGILLDFDHPNQQKYPKQKVLVGDIDGYAILCSLCGKWIYMVLENNLSKQALQAPSERRAAWIKTIRNI
jgi:hypothetical protein